MGNLLHWVGHAIMHAIQHPEDLKWVWYIFLGALGTILLVIVLGGIFSFLSELGDRIFPSVTVSPVSNDPKKLRRSEKVYTAITIALILVIAVIVFIVRKKTNQ